MKNLKEILSRLKQNTMFRLSLGSKELFHTNYWALLLSKYPEVMTKVFCKDSDCHAAEIRREAEHTDLSFLLNNKLTIIENKFKSYPYLEQLERYINSKNVDKITLISFFEPHFLLEENNFNSKIECISYEELFERMNRINLDLIAKEDRPFFCSYLEMLELLQKIKSRLSLKNCTYKEVYEEILEAKEISQEFNFFSTIQKLFLNELRCDLLRDDEIKKHAPFTNVDYASRAKEVFLDIMLNYENNSLGIRNIGITIANNCNIRHYIGAQKLGKERLEIEEAFNSELSWFFQNCTGHKNNNIRFNGYDMKEENCVWLYKTHKSDNILDCKFDGIKKHILEKFKSIKEKLV